MRKLFRAGFRLGDSGAVQRIDGRAFHFVGFQFRLMRANRFFDLGADAHDRIQRGHGLLKNHGNFAAANAAPFAFTQRRQLFRFSFRRQQSFAAHTRSRGKQSHERQRQHCFPAAGFADQTERFARANTQRNVVHGPHPARRRRQLHRQAAHFEKNSHRQILSVAVQIRRTISQMCYTNNVMLTLFGSVPGPFNDSRILQQLETLPKPRIVTVAWRDRVLLLLGFLFSCLWATLWTRAIIESWRKQTGWDVFAVLFLVLFVFLWLIQVRRELRNHSLLTNGDFALGQITSQRESGGKSKRSRITYEFIDTVGRTWSGKGDDLTKKYSENMSVIVFYDQLNQQQNVAICATGWRVRRSDGNLLDLG